MAEPGQYAAFLTSRLVNNPYILSRVNYEFFVLCVNCNLFSSFIHNFSHHPSISSASLQAFCFSATERQLNDLREILQSTSPYPQSTDERNRRKHIAGVLQTVQHWKYTVLLVSVDSSDVVSVPGTFDFYMTSRLHQTFLVPEVMDTAE